MKKELNLFFSFSSCFAFGFGAFFVCFFSKKSKSDCKSLADKVFAFDLIKFKGAI
jgi:hypothetical protein